MTSHNCELDKSPLDILDMLDEAERFEGYENVCSLGALISPILLGMAGRSSTEIAASAIVGVGVGIFFSRKARGIRAECEEIINHRNRQLDLSRSEIHSNRP